MSVSHYNEKRFLYTSSCFSLILAAGLLVGTSGTALANPEDGVITAGSASISSPSANKLDIHQSSQNAVIDWRSFDIAPNEHTQFYQPNSSSTALNRVNSPNASQILGKLSANGNVIIVNQSGIVFGKDAVVDVNGLVATTSDINNNHFMNGQLLFDKAGNPSASIVNKGTITAKDAGLVGLVAPSVTNSGTITAKLGKVQLASGDKFSVDLYGDGLMNITLSDNVSHQLIENSGTVKTEGGTIELTAATGANVVSSLVNITGELLAPSITNKDGKISISAAGSLSHTGTISVNSSQAGTQAGTINVTAKKMAHQGKITADSTSNGVAGSIKINFEKSYLDNQSSVTSAKSTHTAGGKITVTGNQNSNAFVSGQYDVSSTEDKGGITTITTDSGDLKLFGARVKADGKTGGGIINIGGEYQGGGTTVHSSKTGINYATYLSANATDTGNGGNIIVWSDDLTQFAGHASAKGGSISGNGGLIELSSKDTLQVTSNADTNASATHGTSGSLLLDPKNIIIATGGVTGGISSFEFIDPNPDGNDFGGYSSVTDLGNGNWLIADIGDDTNATDAGAVYLFNGATGALISALYGSSTGDQIGSESGYFSSRALGNGNVVISSKLWDNGGVIDAGAVTFINGTTGLSGVLSASNSFVGTQSDDFQSAYVEVLANNNYVILNAAWDNASAIDAGAATWANGTTGIIGTINATNSYIGTTTDDKIGGSIMVLNNGNYVLNSYNWNNGAAARAGAVTWGNGTTGSSGIISAANSLVGTQTDDLIGVDITALSNGNFVTASRFWDNGGAIEAGMVYVGDGTAPTSGIVSAANSIVGLNAGDFIQIQAILSNGKIIVGSEWWDDGATLNVGAIRIIDPIHASAVGPLTTANSLYGSQTDDRIGASGGQWNIDLYNGAIVVGSPYWDNGGIVDAGAATWMDTNSPLIGMVDATNSLVGTTADDMITPIRALSNHNYLAGSFSWDNGGIVDAGAVVWGNGTTGVVGTVTTANSLYGTNAYDFIGSQTGELGNSGNYYIHGNQWDNGGIVDAGSVTWGNGTTGTTGAVSAANSIVGTVTGDMSFINFYCNGSANCLFSTDLWDNGATINTGAVMLVSQTGFSGIIDSSVALVGTNSGDFAFGAYVEMLPNGNYILRAERWDNGGIVDAGAVTWIDGVTGLTGNISAANSLLGNVSGDFSNQYLGGINSNYYTLTSAGYDNGSIVDAGALTFISTTGPTTGFINSTNSITGNATYDITVDSIRMITANTGFMVNNLYDHGSDIDAGAITYFDLSSGPLVGALDESQSIFGGSNSGLYSYDYDSTNNRYIAQFTNERRVISFNFSATLSDFDDYTDSPSSTITLDPTFITNALNAGTSVTLQASNDIMIDDAIIANNAGGNGGTLTFQAGRSILINDDIFTDNGNLNIFANEKLSTGVVNTQRDAGAAVITMASGTTINAGTGNVLFRLDDGAGKTNRGADDITLQTVNANIITAINANTSGDIILGSGGSLTASAATGDSMVLASRRNFINNVGASALNVNGSARWLSYSTNPSDDVIGGLVPAFTLMNCTYGGACGTLSSGNGFLYSFNDNPIVPVVVPDRPVPPTVLYVSQTPPPNIINNPSKGDNTQSIEADNAFQHAEVVPDYFETADNKTYSLFGGWIIIDSALAKKLNLLWSRI